MIFQPIKHSNKLTLVQDHHLNTMTSSIWYVIKQVAEFTHLILTGFLKFGILNKMSVYHRKDLQCALMKATRTTSVCTIKTTLTMLNLDS